jgi:citrate/tricarballylate utilization protein
MRSPEVTEEAKRQLEICNACRYCEGFCAVFPALERRRDFTQGDVDFLANLCHSCKGCFYACQYAPPHPFAVNLPRTLAQARNETYAEYAWPKGAGRLFQRNGMVVSIVTAAVIALTLLGVGWLQDPGVIFGRHQGEGAFYAVIPWDVMSGLAGATFVYALLALGMGVYNFWKGSAAGTIKGAKPMMEATGDVLTLRNLGGGGHGCNDRDESFSMSRRWLHHAMFYGFMLCFASTCAGTVYHHFLGLEAPYAWLSAPVLLGTVGGVLLTVGAGGLLALKVVTDQEPTARSLLGADAALLMLLATVSLTGLVLLLVRSTSAMGVTLAIHLGLVLALFLVLPYSKMVHALYRAAALLRDRQERNGAPIRPEDPLPAPVPPEPSASGETRYQLLPRRKADQLLNP